jgi:hypothetical protein
MTWREAISAALAAHNENWVYIIGRTEFTDEDLDRELYRFPFTIWTANWIYFDDINTAEEYYVRSVPRNPPRGS